MSKKKEMVRYIIWGVLSSLLNIGLFQILILVGIDYKISEIITLPVVKIFVYVTNKLFVFKTSFQDLKSLLKEVIAFIIARSVTMVLDFVGVFFLVEGLKIDTFISKCLVTIVVIIINYILSKRFVFHTKAED